MGNIWEVLMWMGYASLTAAFLLVLKKLLEDKLSPRWQYGIWGIWVLRVFLPLPEGKWVLLPLSPCLEMAKTAVERGLKSAYSEPWEPLKGRFPFPELRGLPVSVTDVLYVCYFVGLMVCLLRATVSYGKLRWILAEGSGASGEVRESVERICERYHLKGCPVREVAGVPSAFVCGLLHPVLAIPAEQVTDEKVILHELLHLKYHDNLQSVFWCVIRALGWWNPFWHYVCGRISNDMESLCDQRVLERLEGEERREYGRILLSMVSHRYAHAPGTTSISNGGKNIARRIGAIVRFKTYPQGMALVSVCIAVTLLPSLLLGSEYVYGDKMCHPGTGVQASYSLAATRLARCTSLAGALDTYAKGLIEDNAVYVAMASPLEEQKKLDEQLRQNEKEGVLPVTGLREEQRINGYANGSGYEIRNIRESVADVYDGILAFPVIRMPDENEVCQSTDCCLEVPVRVWQEKGSWVVREYGERRIRSGEIRGSDTFGSTEEESWLRRSETVGASGTLRMRCRNRLEIDNGLQTAQIWLAGDVSLKRNAEISCLRKRTRLEYIWSGKKRPERYVGVQIVLIQEGESEPVFPEIDWREHHNESGSGFGCYWENIPVDENWDGTVVCEMFQAAYGEKGVQEENGFSPWSYGVRVFWDDVPVEVLVIREGEAE